MRHVLAAKFLDRIEKPARGGLTAVAAAFLPAVDASAMIRLLPRRTGLVSSQLQQQGQMQNARRYLSARRRQAG